MQSFLPTGEGLASKPEVILHSPHGDGVGIGRRSWDVVGDGPEGKQQQSSKAARPLSARGGSPITSARRPAMEERLPSARARTGGGANAVPMSARGSSPRSARSAGSAYSSSTATGATGPAAATPATPSAARARSTPRSARGPAPSAAAQRQPPRKAPPAADMGGLFDRSSSSIDGTPLSARERAAPAPRRATIGTGHSSPRGSPREGATTGLSAKEVGSTVTHTRTASPGRGVARPTSASTLNSLLGSGGFSAAMPAGPLRKPGMPGHAAAIGARAAAAAAAAASPAGGGGAPSSVSSVSSVSSRVGTRQPLIEQPPRLPNARVGTPSRAGPIAAAPVGASARPKPIVPPLGAAAPPKPPVAPLERTPGEDLGFVKQVGVDEEPTSPSTPPLPTPPPPPAASAAAKAAAAKAVAAFTLPYERRGSSEDSSEDASKGVAAAKAADAASSKAAERKAEAAERKAFEAYVSSEPPSSDSEDDVPTAAPAPAPATADKAFALKKGLCLDLSKLRAEDSTPYDPKALPVGIGGAAVASPAIPKLGLGKPPIPALKLGLAGLGAAGAGDGSAAGSEIKPADLRALLKLDLGSISQAGDAQRASGRGGETRPTWEFDLSEITLGHRIGAGAFGEVYEASWRRSRIAVKRLLCQRLTETARREFMQEMQLMSNLRHPHIVRFLGACLEPLQMSILFELCASSLYTVLHVQKQPLQLEYAMGLIRQIALGIFYLHQCKEPVLHLDLKSANVLLDEHGVAKVADFGLSHIKKETAVITARMGSPQWTAPEILRGQPHDESADTYSFGVLMYEIMAARLPYLGIDTFQVVMGVITKMLPRPQLPAECAFPQLLQEMMANCWRENPQERPRFNAILDMADEALETLAMRPQLAGAGGKKAKHAIALDVSRSQSQRSPPSSHGSDRASSRYGSDRASTARSAMLETPPRSSYGSGYGSASETEQQQPRQLLKLGLPTVAPNLALQQGGALAGQANRAVAIALVDYVGQAFDELSFKRGDTIRDVEPHTDALGTALRSGEGPISPIAELRAAGEGGLWMGTLRGRRGLFRGAQVCMSSDDL